MWESIESAPRDGTEILLWRSDWLCPVVAFWEADSFGDCFWMPTENLIADAMGEIDEPSHWFKYPTPPQETRAA